MREFDSSLINPASIVVKATVGASQNKTLKEEVLNFSDDKEYIKYITHKVNNVQHKDGRIYLKIVDGILHANSVSPYSEKFEENIEEKIKPLVLAFKNKRYLTYSSCMGHGYSFRRYIGLAFADEESRSYVASEINKLKIIGVKTKFMDSVSNMRVTKNERTNKPEFQKYSDEQKYREVNEQKEAITFNIQFHRNYEKYYFLELIILDVIAFEYEGLFKEIKKFYYKILKKFFWDKLTQKVLNHIESDSFKKYPY